MRMIRHSLTRSYARLSLRAVLVVLAATAAYTVSSPAIAYPQRVIADRPDSGGPLIPEQAAYDVKSYDISLRIDPAEKSIAGATVIEADVVLPLSDFVFDLDPAMTISSVTLDGGESGVPSLKFERRGRRIWAALPEPRKPGDRLRVKVAYGGKPRVSANPPWADGFIWSKTAAGDPWIGVACQTAGADLWWPCKDHPTDEPERVTLHFTVPKPLVCASNGKLTSVDDNNDGTQTYHWAVSTPINNYNVSVNIAPYKEVRAEHRSPDGTMTPVVFYALPEHEEHGKNLVKEWLNQIRFLESRLGAFPFRADKIGAAETPYLGMEHQTIIAYGADFRKNAYGFDWLLFHEFTHEWFGNLATCPDWNDMWVHEGFTTYMEALYAEELGGADAYHRYAAGFRRGLANRRPVAPREAHTSQQIYGNEIYNKGAAVLHTLRFLIGGNALNKALRRVAYPDPRMERDKSGAACHFTTTEDFRKIAEQLSGQRLDWFFEVYVRQPALPRLHSELSGKHLTLRWEAPNGIAFPMPVEVEIDGSTKRVKMNGGRGRVEIPDGAKWRIDPKQWLLAATAPR